MKHIIIGTAGHIDHGKTTLIKALTGRDTDTLKEEKERGISINLGFTYFDLPSGKRAGIVDVPGHEKFIKNMLAGVSGIDMVLLVIAADEGVMPQTREHLNILSLLDVKRGIVAVTKKDMVDGEWLEAVIDDIKEYLEGTFLQEAPIIPVSSTTKEGIDELVRCIDSLTEEIPEKEVNNSFRLPVDRAFTVAGFGTVVTGTLISGSVSEGDRVQVYPSGTEVKIRNIQVHEQPVKTAYAGQRVAVNLSNIKVEDIKRGDIAAERGCMEPSMMMDCRFNYLKDAEKSLENRTRLRVYHGTSELFGRVVLLDRETINPGDTCLAQIRLESPICAKKGDKYVVRTYSPMLTVGGGTIIDPNPPKRKRFDSRAIEELSTKEKGNPAEVVEQILIKNSNQFLSLPAIAKLSGTDEGNTLHLLSSLEQDYKVIPVKCGDATYYIHKNFVDTMSSKIQDTLLKFHEKYPLKAGMAKEEIKSRLFESSIRQRAFDGFLSLLESKKVIRTNNKFISLYDFKVQMTKSQAEIRERLLNKYKDLGISTSKMDDVISSMGSDASGVRMVFNLMLEQGELIKVNDDMILYRQSYEDALNTLRDYLTKNDGITLAQYRDMLNTNRKCAVYLLEYFDQIKITKRIGENRILN
jgi:selenocysteine-specific elongation factor SelB